MSAVFGIARTPEQAVGILDRLRHAGFAREDVSVLLPDQSGARDFGHEHHTKAPEGATAGAGTGAAVGAGLGWLAGIGALAIPGLGPLIAAGPIMAALSGAAIGGTVGGLAGGLVGMGIPEFEAKQYEGKIRSGNILMSVHSDNSDETARAKNVFEKAGATDISSHVESSIPRQ